LWTYDGECFHPVATYGNRRYAEWLRQRGPVAPASGAVLARIVQGEDFIQIADAVSDDAYRASAYSREVIDITGARTALVVPLRKDNTVLGVIFAYRQEVRPFTDKQIVLSKNFAAQAVIGMENARLINETREALEQKTATAEVLQVINSSPGDLAPVFDAMLEKAHLLCDAAHGSLGTYDSDYYWRLLAARGYPEPVAERLRQGFAGLNNPVTRPLIDGARFVHIPDFAEVDHPIPQTVAKLGGFHTGLFVPLRKDGRLLGHIWATRSEVRPFAEKEIALLENFAAQAVIAMENARSYADYLRILADRGEFGTEDIEAELNRRLEATDQELRLERTRLDGRVIEVRRNSVPDGGFALIYSDITERKRSEAEIHAAREAAEAAYRDLKAAQANLVHAEKMASLGQLTAGIAHEIKNPLNFVNNFADLSVELLDELKEIASPAITALGQDKRAEIDETIDMLTGNLEKIAEHGKRADGIVKSMLEHSRGSSGERRSVDINGLIEEALNLAYHGARAQDQSFNVTLERDFADAIALIELVPQDLTRVCLNLFSNGFYATTERQREGGDPKFQPTLKVATRDLGEAVEIRIRDNGTGIPPEARDKLFQPFFTTKPSGEGTGLGLSISWDIVTQQHGGTIEVDSRVGEFTEFAVRLPRARQATPTEAPA
jgi:two-component system, NtrC family, sensor kinase